MAACEKCWADAFFRAQSLGGSPADHHDDLLAKRRGAPCSLEDQRGDSPTPDPKPRAKTSSASLSLAYLDRREDCADPLALLAEDLPT